MEWKKAAAIFVLALMISGSNGQNFTTINPGNGVDRGEWGSVAYCPPGTYAAQFEMKYQPRGDVDDTCANAVKLYCYDTSGNFFDYVTSSEGEDGSWQGLKSCPTGNFIIGYAMRVEGLVGNFDDDLGVINVRVECQDGTILEGVPDQMVKAESREEKIPPPEAKYKTLRHKLTPEEIEKFSKREGVPLVKKFKAYEDGTWGPLATCPNGYVVCGLQTQVEPVHLVDDDAGLCDMNFICCSY